MAVNEIEASINGGDIEKPTVERTKAKAEKLWFDAVDDLR